MWSIITCNPRQLHSGDQIKKLRLTGHLARVGGNQWCIRRNLVRKTLEKETTWKSEE